MVAAAVPEDVKLAEEGKLPKDMGARIRYARTDRQAHIAMWDTCLAFLHGNQRLRDTVYSTYNVSRRDQKGRDKAFATSNRMLPIYRSSIATLRMQMPKMHAGTLNPSYDTEVSKTVTKYALRAWWTLNDLDVKGMTAIQWMSPTGNVGWHTYFNPVTECVCTEVIRPYDIVWEAENRSTAEADWGAVRKMMTRAAAIEMYPEDRDYLLTVPVETDEDGNEVRKLTDRLEFWHVYYKDGRCGVWCCDKWLFETETPEGIFPISMSRWTVFPDWLWGMSQMFPLIDPQIQYNMFRSFMLDSARLMSNPMWLIPTQAGVRQSQLTNNPGQPIMYNGMAPAPQRVPAPAIPPHVFDIQSRQLGEMEDLAGMHSPTMGKRAPGISAAVSMQQLSQGDFNQFLMTTKEIERALCEQAQCAMVLWKAYMPQRKTVSVFSEAYAGTVTKVINATELVDAPSVTIEANSSFVATTEEKDAKLIELAQLRIVDPETVKRNLSFQIDERSEMDRVVNLVHARELLEALLNGHNVEFDEYSEPPLFMAVRQVFGEYVRAPEFYEGVAEAKQSLQMNPEDVEAQNRIMVQQNIWTLYQEAGMLLQQGMQQQGQQQSPTGGLGGGLRNPNRGAPSNPGAQGAAARPALNDERNPTAQGDSIKMRTGGAGM